MIITPEQNQIIVDSFLGVLYQSRKKEWFFKKNLPGVYPRPSYKSIEPFDVDTVEGHFGVNKAGDTLYIHFEGSDSDLDQGRDWTGEDGNLNWFPKKLVNREPVTGNADLKIRIHGGYRNACQKIKRQIHKKSRMRCFKKIITAGHSRGGSFAVKFAEELGWHYHNSKDVYCVNIAGGKVFNSYGVESLVQHTKWHIKIWYGDDPVPYKPVVLGGLSHEKNRLWLSKNYLLPWNWLTFLARPIIGNPWDHEPDKIYEAYRRWYQNQK
jgi:hypothetical protein